MRQTKTVNSRKMIVLFSKKYGKISAGTGISEKGKGKSALAMRPFTFGRYELYKNRDIYNINSAETIHSFYALGEDIDKYMYASYILEFTDKLLAEGKAAPGLFALLLEYFEVMSERKREYETLILAFQAKALSLMGVMPVMDSCAACGRNLPAVAFSVPDGGTICAECRNNIAQDFNVSLLFDLDFDIVDILKFFIKSPLKSLEKITLKEEIQWSLAQIMREYCKYHLDIINLKRESFLKLYR